MRVALKLSIGIIHKTEKRFFQPRSGPVHRTLLTLISLSFSQCLSLSHSLCCTVRTILWSAIATYLPDHHNDDLDFAVCVVPGTLLDFWSACCVAMFPPLT